MRYPYKCPGCNKETDIIKSVKEIDNKEACSYCDTIMTRLVVGGVGFTGEKVEDAEFNPGLGCVTKNKKHRAEIAKSMGLVEVGNEDMGKITDTMNKEREKKLASRYDGLEKWWHNEKRIEI